MKNFKEILKLLCLCVLPRSLTYEEEPEWKIPEEEIERRRKADEYLRERFYED